MLIQNFWNWIIAADLIPLLLILGGFLAFFFVYTIWLTRRGEKTSTRLTPPPWYLVDHLERQGYSDKMIDRMLELRGYRRNAA